MDSLRRVSVSGATTKGSAARAEAGQQPVLASQRQPILPVNCREVEGDSAERAGIYFEVENV
jgi:hypothetical protein